MERLANDNCGIYCFENNLNGSKYVGQSSNLKTRISRHLRELNKNKDKCIVLQNAWNKYGKENFSYYIVEICDKEFLDEKEIFYIQELKSHVSNGGYNVSLGGNAPMRGRKVSDETKNKISSKNKGLLAGEKNPFYGKAHTEEDLKKMSENHKNMSGENNGMYGRKHTEETKRKMSENYNPIRSPRGSPTNETKRKISEGNIGKKHSQETKEQMSRSRIFKKQKKSSSKYIGVCFDKFANNWMAYIRYNKRTIHLGRHKSEIEAALAYNAKAIELYGNDASLNKID